MKRLKIAIILGTRPEAIKCFPIIKELQKYPEQFQPIIISTGQHKELIYQVFEDLDFKPDQDFGVMEINQSLGNLTNKLLPHLINYFTENKPDMVLIEGDTTSAFLGALAGYYAKVRVAHIEAGLRTHLKFNPFPEEMNRVLIGQLAGYHFAPTYIAKQNLLQENIPENQIFVTGNTIIDAVEYMVKQDKLKVTKEFQKDTKNRVFFLVTIHRRENFGEPMENIRLALEKIAATSDIFQIIFPLHPNPNVQRVFKDFGKGISNIHVLAPVSYSEFLCYIKMSFLILTDSGGLVEEASYFGKPVLILREVTERPESIDAGIARIVGTQASQVYNVALHYYTCQSDYQKMAVEKKYLYGDGKAAQKIIKLLSKLCQ